MVKRNRRYVITLKLNPDSDELVRIELPFTVELDITRNNLSSSNRSKVRIYNLAKILRDQIRKDITTTVVDPTQSKKMVIQAGYGSDLAVIFNGNIIQAFSVREGVNYITNIEAFDGGDAFNIGSTNASFPGGTPVKSVITSMAQSLRNFGVDLGAIGDYAGQIARGNSYAGSTMDIMRELTGGGAFIDNGRIHVLKDNEYIDGPLLTISPESGLLGTPLRENFLINFDMLFEPKLYVGGLVNLKSETDQSFNGVYKVMSVRHNGMISEAVSGTMITSMTVFNSQPFFAVKSATGI